jgi:hypothetical protein
MSASIILIGPGKAGKTTLSKRLGAALNMTAIDLDDLRFGYYEQIGYDAAKAKEIRQAGGMAALAAHWRPFDIYGVECCLRDYPSDHVIAFGAGHSIYDDESHLQRAIAALAPFPHVIFLLPTPGIEESAAILRQRLHEDEPDFVDATLDDIMAINSTFINHPSNIRLATMTVYTAGKTSDETCAEILQKLHHDAV